MFLALILFAFWFNHESKDNGGYLSGIGTIIPAFFFLLFVIAWLIVFFVIL